MVLNQMFFMVTFLCVKMVYCIALHYSYLRRTTEICTMLKVLTDVGAFIIFDLENIFLYQK